MAYLTDVPEAEYYFGNYAFYGDPKGTQGCEKIWYERKKIFQCFWVLYSWVVISAGQKNGFFD